MNYLILLDTKDIPEGYEEYLIADHAYVDAIALCQTRNLKYNILDRNWENGKMLVEDIDYLKFAQRKITEFAAQILNEYHNTNYNYEQWEIMLSQWMVIYLSAMYDKYLKLKAIEAYGEEYICVLPSLNQLMISLDYVDFSSWVANIAFHQYCYICLIEDMKPENIKLVNAAESLNYKFKQPCKGDTYNWKIKLFNVLYKTFQMILHKRDEISIIDKYEYLPQKIRLEAMLAKPGKITQYIYQYQDIRYRLDAPTDYEWRNLKKAQRDFNDEFIALLCEMLGKFLPSSYLENFDKLIEITKKIYRYAFDAKKVIYDYSGISSNEVNKVYLMFMKGKQSLLCDMQHGGCYGTDYSLALESEYQTCDVLYTWGWTLSLKDCKFKPLGVHKLLGVKKDNNISHKILYIGYSKPKFWYKLSSYFINPELDRENELQFFKSLSEKVKKDFVIRLYKTDYGWWYSQSQLEKYVSNLRFDYIKKEELGVNENYYRSVQQACLVVSPEFSTSILEALAIGKPVLFKCEIGCVEKESIDELISLKQVGVLVETWDELSETLERISDNVGQWWNEPERKKEVERFQRKYACLSDDTWENWSKEIISIM